MTESEFCALVDQARTYLEERQDALNAEFKLGTYERFDWHQTRGELIFSSAGVPQVRASFEFVGTLSDRSGTWRWAWANDSLQSQVVQNIREVRTFGEAHALPPILEDEWAADEVDAWDMTALAAHLLQAAGAYRAPGARGASFLVLKDVAWVAAVA